MQTIIQTPCANFKKAKEFYRTLNFKELESSSAKALFTDGKSFIEINTNRTTRLSIVFIKKSWKEEVKQLEKIVKVSKIENCYLFAMPSGTWIKLIEDIPKELKHETAFSVLGNNMGLSLETTDIKKSMAILNVLGFAKTMGKIEQGWLIMKHKNQTGISLMVPNVCPHLFFNPSLTFFNGKENNPKIIQKIRDLNIEITEEITSFNKDNIVDNVILRDNGGLGFFIFND